MDFSMAAGLAGAALQDKLEAAREQAREAANQAAERVQANAACKKACLEKSILSVLNSTIFTLDPL